MKSTSIAILALALAGWARAYDPDADADAYDGEGDEGYGGVGGGGEPDMSMSGGEMQDLTSVEEFEAFLDDVDASVIGAFTVKEMADPDAKVPEEWDAEEDGEWEAPVIENPDLTAFKELTSSNYGYRYATTFEPVVLERLKSKAGGLYLYRSPKLLSPEHGDKPRERYPSGKLNVAAATNWIQTKAQPLVGLYNSKTAERYRQSTVVIFMNANFETNAKNVKYVLKRARKVAVGLKGKLSVALSPSSEMSWDLKDFGLEVPKPSSDIRVGIRTADDGHSRKYYGSAETTFSEKNLQAFADDFLAGKLTPYERPDPPPPPPYGDEDDKDADMDMDMGFSEDQEEANEEANEPYGEYTPGEDEPYPLKDEA